MADINLIPRDYSEARRVRASLRLLGLALAAIVALTAAARGWIALRFAEERPNVEQMRQHVKLAADRQAELAELEARRASAESSLASLHALRDSGAWVAMFQTIDRAYNRNLWFDELAFAHTVQLDSLPADSPAADAVRHVPAELPSRIGQRFEVKGHALDHTALSEFMRALSEQPGVLSVRLTDTGLRKYSTIEVVDFSLSASLDQRGMTSR